jgi:uncharacterized membrane protein YsdA (DUF1294 family)
MTIPSLFIPIIIYFGLNILACTVFTLDKLRAKRKRERIPENSLLLLAALGPIGALTAMVAFRHKTRHMKFFLVPVFAILHLLLFIWIWHQIVV